MMKCADARTGRRPSNALELYRMGSGDAVIGDYSALGLQARNSPRLGFGEFQPDAYTAAILVKEHGSERFKGGLDRRDCIRLRLAKLAFESLDDGFIDA